jgi:hypothetical protein
VAVIWVGESTVKLALTKPSVTEVAPVNLAPEIVTVPPTPPLAGEKPVIVGDATVKTSGLTAVPAPVVTRQYP